jgi:hypothetical protein
MVMHAYNRNTQEHEAGGSIIPNNPELCCEILSKNNEKKERFLVFSNSLRT